MNTHNNLFSCTYTTNNNRNGFFRSRPVLHPWPTRPSQPQRLMGKSGDGGHHKTKVKNHKQVRRPMRFVTIKPGLGLNESPWLPGGATRELL
ncbi:hypothetical protein RESH_06095 [Rhodopirellula europaea SH398]|uniref:Uncharacterized protein n=1 Tax=Rhodopirellula europaea SH398 TaxID=1263868 RepID=M5RVH0_9BACT|nr:hypothetical protein RESH_06095 [Rhodopirellula europaea SH398]